MNIDDLKRRWPLFDIIKDGKGYRIIFAPYKELGSSSMYITEEYLASPESAKMLERNDIEHKQLKVDLKLQERYPHLYFFVDTSYWRGLPDHIWVRRKNQGGEAIVCREFSHEILGYWEEQARLATQDGWFFCTGHNRAEEGKRAWFHFAGSYCEEYGKEHPEKRREAERESYN
jgi:hypothetical protein